MRDELMEEITPPEIFEVLFQFNEEEPVQFALMGKNQFSLTLSAENVDDPSVEFSDGKGKFFRIFLRKSQDGIQQEVLQHGNAEEPLPQR